MGEFQAFSVDKNIYNPLRMFQENVKVREMLENIRELPKKKPKKKKKKKSKKKAREQKLMLAHEAVTKHYLSDNSEMSKTRDDRKADLYSSEEKVYTFGTKRFDTSPRTDSENLPSGLEERGFRSLSRSSVDKDRGSKDIPNYRQLLRDYLGSRAFTDLGMPASRSHLSDDDSINVLKELASHLEKDENEIYSALKRQRRHRSPGHDTSTALEYSSQHEYSMQGEELRSSRGRLDDFVKKNMEEYVTPTPKKRSSQKPERRSSSKVDFLPNKKPSPEPERRSSSKVDFLGSKLPNQTPERRSSSKVGLLDNKRPSQELERRSSSKVEMLNTSSVKQSPDLKRKRLSNLGKGGQDWNKKGRKSTSVIEKEAAKNKENEMKGKATEELNKNPTENNQERDYLKALVKKEVIFQEPASKNEPTIFSEPFSNKDDTNKIEIPMQLIKEEREEIFKKIETPMRAIKEEREDENRDGTPSKRSSMALSQQDSELIGTPFGSNQYIRSRASFGQAPTTTVPRASVRGSVRFDPAALPQFQEKAEKRRSTSPLQIEDVLSYSFVPPEPTKKEKPFHDRLRSRQQLMGILLKHCPEELGINKSDMGLSMIETDAPLSKKPTGPRFSVLEGGGYGGLRASVSKKPESSNGMRNPMAKRQSALGKPRFSITRK